MKFGRLFKNDLNDHTSLEDGKRWPKMENRWNKTSFRTVNSWNVI